MKIKLEFDVPEIEKISVPTRYLTPIGEFAELDEVNAIGELIEYLKRLPDINWIINSDHKHVRHPLCRELVRSRLKFTENFKIWNVGENLSHFLNGFSKHSGKSFKQYKFDYQIVINEDKFRFKDSTKIFNTEEQAIRYFIGFYVSHDDLPLNIVR